MDGTISVDLYCEDYTQTSEGWDPGKAGLEWYDEHFHEAKKKVCEKFTSLEDEGYIEEMTIIDHAGTFEHERDEIERFEKIMNKKYNATLYPLFYYPEDADRDWISTPPIYACVSTGDGDTTIFPFHDGDDFHTLSDLAHRVRELNLCRASSLCELNRMPDVSNESTSTITREAILRGLLKENWEEIFRSHGYLNGQADSLHLRTNVSLDLIGPLSHCEVDVLLADRVLPDEDSGNGTTRHLSDINKAKILELKTFPSNVDKAIGQLARYRDYLSDKFNIGYDDIEATVVAPRIWDSHQRHLERFDGYSYIELLSPNPEELTPIPYYEDTIS